MEKEDPHSIRHEPALNGADPVEDDSAYLEPALGYDREILSEEERIYHNVWDEPSSGALSHRKPNHLENYSERYRRKDQEEPETNRWIRMLAFALIGGPIAIGATVISQLSLSINPIFGAVVFAPLVEELTKPMVILIAVEKRPYWFSSRIQIVVGVAFSALVFAVLENLMYIHVYIEDPSESLIRWRWTVCVMMHVGASVIASMGIMRIWHHSRQDWGAPQIHYGYPYFVTAMLFHGGYNLFAVVISTTLEPF
jgi:RsiW-degrading membrane proteinase PrsW (M82 family)